MDECVGELCNKIDDVKLKKMDEELKEIADTEKEKETLLNYIEDANRRLTNKNELRKNNQSVAKPSNSSTGKLDSSLKKNTAFVRKLRNFTGQQLDELKEVMSGLNLSMYLSEVASAIVDAKLKLTDVPAAVTLCSELHRSYPEFSKVLRDSWSKILSLKKDEKISNPSKLRVDLRFYGDLITSGVFPSKEALPLLGNILTFLTTTDKEDHNNISIILSFCKYCGEDYAGLVPQSIRILSEKYQIEIPKSCALPPEKQKNVRTLLKDYYASLCKHLLKEHSEIQVFERQNKKILQTKGELSSDRKEKSEMLSAMYQKLLNGTQNLSEVLDEELPILPEEKSSKMEYSSKFCNLVQQGEEITTQSDIWEDEETQQFYQEFPNLKDFLPNFKISKDLDKNQLQFPQITEEALDQDLEEEVEDDSKKVEEETLNIDSGLVDADEYESSTNVSSKAVLDAFLAHLPECVNRELIDNAAIEFLMSHNTKSHRKKLIKTLFGVPRTRTDLLPFYSRLVAILNPVMPEIAIDLSQLLKQDFKYHIRKKDQINIESKIKVIRFIGELVKFQLYPKVEGLYCLKVLLHDFTHHHIEMACNFLETCGRFFYRSSDTHHRTKVYLEQMMRKKSVMSLDWRYVTMIENAYYHVNPPESPVRKVLETSPLEKYIDYCLYHQLMVTGVESEKNVILAMRKLDWDKPQVSRYAIERLVDAARVKYLNIQNLANLLAGLVDYQEFVGAQVVDGVLEDIRLGMEINHKKLNQRRIAMIKYLGELYNYRMVESNDVFKVLYSLISFGISMSYQQPSPLDPPDNLFRIRLVCVLLDTCGQFFNHGVVKTKLNYFFVFFQNYFLFKYNDPIWTDENPFPVNINYMFRDTLLSLRPNLKFFTSYEESQEAVIELQKKLYPDIGCKEQETDVKLILDIGNQDSPLNTIWESDDDETARPRDNSAGTEVKDDNPRSCVDSSSDFLNKDDTKVHNMDEEEEEDYSIEEENEEDLLLVYDLNSQRSSEEDNYEPNSEEVDNCNAMLYEQDSSSCNNIRRKKHRHFEDEQSAKDDCRHLNLTTPSKSLSSKDEFDYDFINEFDKMVSENIQDRLRQPSVKSHQVDISVPLHFKNSNIKKTYEQLQEPEVENKCVNFVLMLRKGNKQQYKSLAVPVDSELAVNLKSQEKAERVEMERVKRLTLDINDRLEEEDYQDQILQGVKTTATTTLNREKRSKYQHPKGAPDADLIFGRKKFQR